MRPHHYAVISGINRYVSLDDLRGPVNDAEAFQRWLVDPHGGDVPEKNIVWVEASAGTDAIDADSAQPTATRIYRAFLDVNKRLSAELESSPESREQSRLYGYLAGHGTAPGGTGCAVLMPSADEDGLVDHVEVQLLADWYGRSGPFKEVLFFVDCCREDLHLLPCGPPMVQEWLSNDPVSVVLGLAAEVGQQALEPLSETDGIPLRGYFTTALLEGMAMSTDAAGRVTVAGLDGHVRRLVLRRTDRRQLASVRQQRGMPVVVRRTKPRETHRVRVRCTGTARNLVIRDEYEDILARGDARHETPWELELPNGVYWVGPKEFAAGDLSCEFVVEGRDTDVRYPAGTTLE
ncbi:caspase family protein [Streptomyces pseudovenezuelae]|uniref:Peptidase C14 caspase domain-containing protein n=1 Tax=Streptomyces pseudovenezuelae TaxID=67350 RepID=A0ABT6LU19_9ACTN|nr:caspase family protein [Streptomyces pseudovenezuelae]MDH6219206.1 hypothetical protein [Streptomyces pseudovenezuelae]